MNTYRDKMTDVLLISPPFYGGEYTDSLFTAVPLGLIRIATSLKSAGIKASVVNLTPIQDKRVVEEILDWELGKLSPKAIIGVSMNISALRKGAHELIYYLRKKLPETTIGVGGIHATELYKTLLEKLPIDFVALGEAEKSFLNFAERVINGEDINVPGIAVKERISEALVMKPVYEMSMDQLPVPDYGIINLKIPLALYSSSLHKYDIEDMNLENGLVVESSRGCPYRCSFCGVAHRPYRYHSSEYMIDYLEALYKNHGFTSYTFVDDYFSYSRERTLHLMDALRGCGMPVTWAAQTRADNADREIFSSMKAAGCRLVAFGIETGSKIAQGRIRKNVSLEKAAETIALAKECGLLTQTFFLVGHPGESDDDIAESKQFISAAKPDFLCVDVLKIFPGTELYREKVEKGGIDDNYWIGDECDTPLYNSEVPVAVLKRRKERLEYIWRRYRRKPPPEVFAKIFNIREEAEITGVGKIREAFCGSSGCLHMVVLNEGIELFIRIEYSLKEQVLEIHDIKPDYMATSDMSDNDPNEIITNLKALVSRISSNQNS